MGACSLWRVEWTEVLARVSRSPVLLVGVATNQFRPIPPRADHRHHQALSARIADDQVLPPNSHVRHLLSQKVTGMIIGHKAFEIEHKWAQALFLLTS